MVTTTKQNQRHCTLLVKASLGSLLGGHIMHWEVIHCPHNQASTKRGNVMLLQHARPQTTNLSLDTLSRQKYLLVQMGSQLRQKRKKIPAIDRTRNYYSKRTEQIIKVQNLKPVLSWACHLAKKLQNGLAILSPYPPVTGCKHRTNKGVFSTVFPGVLKSPTNYHTSFIFWRKAVGAGLQLRAKALRRLQCTPSSI